MMAAGRDEPGSDGGELVSDVAEVAGLGRLGYDFIDDRPEVVEARDRRERCGARGAEGSARDGEEQRRVYHLERDAAVVECARELTVTAAQVPGGAWSEEIQFEDTMDVEPARDR